MLELLSKGLGAAGEITLPTFPTIDLTETVSWMAQGFIGIVTSNAALVIGAGIGMAALPAAIKKIKSFGKSAVKG